MTIQERMVVGEEAKERLDTAIQSYSINLHILNEWQKALNDTIRATAKERARVMLEVVAAKDEDKKPQYPNEAAREAAVENVMDPKFALRKREDEFSLANAKADVEVAMQVIRAERGFLAFLAAAMGAEEE